jgi:hypothetical protein
VLITAVFTIVKLSKQLKCPTTDEENVVTYTVKYYSAIKKKEIVIFLDI